MKISPTSTKTAHPTIRRWLRLLRVKGVVPAEGEIPEFDGTGGATSPNPGSTEEPASPSDLWYPSSADPDFMPAVGSCDVLVGGPNPEPGEGGVVVGVWCDSRGRPITIDADDDTLPGREGEDSAAGEPAESR